MIDGVHAIVFSPLAEEVRAFIRDVLGLPSVDAGGGWLIYALPPSELAVHPADTSAHELYLMSADLDATIAALASKGIATTRPITEQRWGRVTAIALPDGSEIGLYQPAHPRPGSSSTNA
jgi:uncharacterized glyoxalase superfamily protein PhnB